jgi:flagellin
MINSINYAANSYSTSQGNLLTALEALSSGRSINSAADNPAGYVESTSYSVQLSSTAQSINNIQDSVSMLNTAGGGAGQITQNLQDINTLTVEAGDGALSSSDLQSIQSQIGQLTQNIDQIAGSTQFNGQNLLDGSANLTVQTGANGGQTQNVQIGNLSSSALGISNIDVTTPAGQAAALSSVSNALAQVNSQSINIGAATVALDSTLSNQSTTYNNLAAANSQVSDTDYAATSTNLAQANVQSQVALQAMAMYNSMQSNVLGLLPK